MALFQPTNVIPSTLSGAGNGTVDVTKALVVSWQVNGNSPMVAYQIKIMQNDTDSTLKLDTGKVTLPSPFYGADQWGNPVLFDMEISAADLFTAGIENGYENGYKMAIKQWWNANDSVEQSSASYFITRNEPSVTLQIIPYQNSFRLQEHTFEAFYSQAQGDAIEWRRWELEALENGKYVTVDDTGYIYGGSLIPYDGYYGMEYTYNGFVIGTEGIGTGVKYRIRCTVQTENGVQASNGWTEFTTQTISGVTNAPLRLCNIREKDAIMIQMPKNFPLMGKPDGVYSIDEIVEDYTYALNLPDASSVTWGGTGEDSLNVKDIPHSIQVKMDITDASVPVTFFTALYQDKTLEFSYNSSGFSIRYGDTLIWNTSTAPVLNAQACIALTNESVYFGINNNGSVTYETYDIQEWQDSEMESVSLHGPGKFRFVWIVKGNMTGSTASYFIYSANAVPYQNENTEFLVTFLYETLYSGGNLISKNTQSFAIYRKSSLSPIYKLIANVPFDETARNMTVYDYSAKNGETYSYYFLCACDKGVYDYYIEERNGIGTVVPCAWNYTVMCCRENNNGDYIVESEYRFAMDISSGNVGNNNTPTMQQNFTRYPTRQPVSNMYRSGTLSAFIGKVENDRYVDTARLMDELYALSTNGMTKFLKTRKGQLFRIETSAPVVMNIGDRYAEQPAKISLPWVEVGDAGDANILQGDGFIEDAPTFHVDPETMELTMHYSMRSKMGANSFELLNGNLYLINPGAYDADDFSLSESREVILDTN